MEKSYRYLGYYLLLFIPLIFAAFYKSYLVKFPHYEINFDNTIHIHAFLASLWVLMLIVQPFLIVNKELAWHRLVGKLSYVVFPLLILSFIPGIAKLINSGETIFIFFPISDCLYMIVLYSLAIFYKKKSPKHMRFMIASSLALLGPTIGRIFPRYFDMSEVDAQTVQYAITFSILFALILMDRKNKRDYNPYSIAAGLVVIHAAVFYFLFL
ncbi:hypothetical protein [Dyadobacter arcticus]|uniref:Uncharacterized protein n=1 Tax=Dyadobacter arcticus TaxID=1078754 RepID=A0ABX0UQ06_9BACT|nr:hypothetical protein [Dyadobacter arcticus]NIJ54209.1 hypothetical protein [Dyadobacter arcticus]